MKMIFGLLELVIGLVLIVLLAPAFWGGQVAYPLTWVGAFVPDASWNGGFLAGVLSFGIRTIVLLVIIAACVGMVRVVSRRVR